LEVLLKRLKSGLGTGGTVKDSSLEIQGDHCNAVITALANMGYRPKRSGS
jgi:translation initiation factor 1